MMTPEQTKAVDELQSEGYAVIVWSPEELGEANPRRVEDASVEQGWYIIHDLGGPSSE